MTAKSDECVTETELLRLFERALSPERRAEIEAHFDRCPACFRLVAEVARGMEHQSSSSGGDPSTTAAVTDPGSSSPSIGAVVQGRYEIAERVGIGAMGVVYAAYDRVLERKVALKVMRPDKQFDARAAARLIREARLLARLSHPNVAIVHDVIQTAESVFIAMELVVGRTLRDWLMDARRPSRDQLLAAFLYAGRGLAAAHAAGVIHRDFKPDNVLLGDNGSVRVIDFGLAQGTRQVSNSQAPFTSDPSSQASQINVAGTPRYMAPEQLEGSAADAHSDQFAFAVSLYEALYSKPPFPLTSQATRLAAIRSGNVDIPVRPGIPRRLRAVLARGLQSDPARRFPSMDAMCDALDAARRPRQRTLVHLMVSTTAVLVGGLMLPAVDAQHDGSCRGASDRLAGVWNDDVRREVDAALATSTDADARARWVELTGDLDAAATQWSERYDAACAHMTEDDPVVLDRSRATLACLERQLPRIEMTVAMARRGDSTTLTYLGRERLAEHLSHDCAPPDPTETHTPWPMDEQEVRRRIQLAEIEMLVDAGRLVEARPLAAYAVEDARRKGFAPVLAEALLHRGAIERKLGALADAEQTIEQALATAETAGHDRLLAECWFEVALLDIAFARFAEASRSIDRAAAFLARKPPEPPRMAYLGTVRANILHGLGRHRDAIVAVMRAREHLQHTPGNELILASSMITQSNAHAALGEWAQALALNRRVLELRERHLGPEHTRVAGALNNIGALLMEEGDYEGARQHLHRAREIRETRGKGDALDISNVQLNFGHLERRLGRWTEARAHYERALALREELLGPRHLLIAEAQHSLGALLVEAGEPNAGAQLLERARASRDRTLGPMHPSTALTLVELAHADLVRGSPDSALARLETAFEVLAVTEVSPAERADTEFLHAQALDAAGGDPLRARLLAESARETFGELGPAYADEQATVAQFLAASP